MTTSLTNQRDTLFPSLLSTAPITLSTAWMPLAALVQDWATFGAHATDAPALTATGMAFLALAWETSALHHRTWAYQDRLRGRSRSAVRDLGQAIRHWSQAALWLERQALDERHPVEDPELVRALLRQVLSQQQRLWTLMQEVQEDLLAYGQPVAEEPVRAGACNASEDQEKGTP